MGWDKDSLITWQRKLLLPMVTVISMQNKLYTTPDHQLHNQSLSSDRRTWNLRISWILCHSPKRLNSLKSSNFWKKRIKEEIHRKEEISAPQPTPFINWAWHLWYGMFPWPSWVICLAVLPPSSRTAAHPLNTGDWKKSLISYQRLNTSVLPTFFWY